MFPQTDESWHYHRSLNQNWSYQPTLAGRAIIRCVLIGNQNDLCLISYTMSNSQIATYRERIVSMFRNRSYFDRSKGCVPEVYSPYVLSVLSYKIYCLSRNVKVKPLFLRNLHANQMFRTTAEANDESFDPVKHVQAPRDLLLTVPRR